MTICPSLISTALRTPDIISHQFVVPATLARPMDDTSNTGSSQFVRASERPVKNVQTSQLVRKVNEQVGNLNTETNTSVVSTNLTCQTNWKKPTKVDRGKTSQSTNPPDLGKVTRAFAC